MPNIDFSLGSGLTFRISYTETVDEIANTSVVAITPQLRSTTYSGVGYWLDGTIKVNGQTVLSADSAMGSHYFEIQSAGSSYDTLHVTTGYAAPPYSSGTILHETDGTGKLRVEISITCYKFGISSAPSRWTVSETAERDLTVIPRAVSIYATNCYIEGTSHVSITRTSAAFTHSISYSFGSLSGYIHSDGSFSSTEQKMTAETIDISIPTSWYAQIPNAKYGTATLTAKTYNGTTLIGTKTTTFTATARESTCKPTLTATVRDANAVTVAVTGDATKLVRYKSTAQCTATPTAKNSATIVSTTINGVSGTSRIFANVETTSFVFTTTDSRGYQTSVTVTPTMIPYIKLTGNPILRRPQPTTGQVTLTMTGDVFVGSFGAQSNTLGIRVRAREQGATTWGSWQTVTGAVTSGNAYTLAETSLGTVFTYTKAYDFEVEITDRLSTVVMTGAVYRGIPVFDWGENDFNFNVPIKLNGVEITDHVIGSHESTGTGDWSWKKYASGDAVLYGRFSVRPASWSDAGGKYYYSASTLIELPFDLTNAIVSGTANSVALVTNCSVDEDGLWLRLIRWSNEVTDFTVQMIVYGKWS